MWQIPFWAIKMFLIKFLLLILVRCCFPHFQPTIVTDRSISLLLGKQILGPIVFGSIGCDLPYSCAHELHAFHALGHLDTKPFWNCPRTLDSGQDHPSALLGAAPCLMVTSSSNSWGSELEKVSMPNAQTCLSSNRDRGWLAFIFTLVSLATLS